MVNQSASLTDGCILSRRRRGKLLSEMGFCHLQGPKALWILSKTKKQKQVHSYYLHTVLITEMYILSVLLFFQSHNKSRS